MLNEAFSEVGLDFVMEGNPDIGGQISSVFIVMDYFKSMGEGLLGRPYDDSRGTIREIMVNYHPAAHCTISESIKAMPHVDFIVFDGPGKEDIRERIMGKASTIDRPEMVGLIRDWMGMVKESAHRLNDYYTPLINERIRMEMSSDIFSKDYFLLRNFLEMAALTHYGLNLNHKSVTGLSVEKIAAEFPDQVEVVKVDYPLSNFSRDAVIPLYKKDERVIVPSNQGLSPDIIGQLDMGYHEMAADPVWERRGYRKGENLNVKSIVGGNVVAHDRYIFIGMNPFEQSLIANGPESCSEDMERIRGDAELKILRDSEIYDHADVLIMPGRENEMYVSDPAETRRLLKKSGVKTRKDNKFMEPYMKFFPKLRGELESLGYEVKSAPFWVTSHDGYPTMLSYCNNLQEEGKIYAPRMGSRSESRRVREIGSILDEWFYDTVSDYKEIIPIEGFDIPSAWKDAGVRCLNNVLWRE